MQYMPTPVDIDVVDATEGDGFIDGMADLTENPIRVNGKRDMVDKILARLKPGECIRRLSIHGHGNEGNISIGGGRTLQYCKRINGHRAEWEPELSRLKGKFCPDAVLILNGCNVGAGQSGADKLAEVADVLGVTVRAPTSKKTVWSLWFFGWHYWGPYYEDGNKWQEARPGVHPDPIPRPSEAKKLKKLK